LNATGSYISERPDTFQGKPARLVEVRIAPEEVANEGVAVKENMIVAQFWIGANGVPLGALMTHTVKARLMVFLNYERSTRDEMIFGVAGNRLVVLKRDSQGKEQGAGERVRVPSPVHVHAEGLAFTGARRTPELRAGTSALRARPHPPASTARIPSTGTARARPPGGRGWRW
jgi:hypothetical protein